MGQKRALVQAVFMWTGHAVVWAAGADMGPKEMASNISISPYFPVSSSENATLHCRGHSPI